MSFFRKKKVAFFVTGNIHKFNEARKLLAEHNVATAMLNLEAIEIQDDSLENIAKASAVDIAEKSSLPFFVEDAGLFVEALNGFPGPYSSYVHRIVGNKGILKLMENEKKRDAYFLSVVAFCNPEKPLEPKCFRGTIEGKVSYKERGKQGFGFDPIFEPYGGNGKTFAEMTTQEKNKYSHRAQALRKFARWYSLHAQRI